MACGCQLENAAAAALPTNYAVCYSEGNDFDKTMYFSAPFQVANGPASPAQVRFTAFLRTKYQYTGGGINCGLNGGLFKTLAATQSFIQKKEDEYRPRRKVVHTGWTPQQ